MNDIIHTVMRKRHYVLEVRPINGETFDNILATIEEINPFGAESASSPVG